MSLGAVEFRHAHGQDDEGGPLGDVWAHHEGREVGHLAYESNIFQSGVYVQDLRVEPDWRRRGLGGALYEQAYERHGLPYVHDTESMTPEGRALAEAHARKRPDMHDWV